MKCWLRTNCISINRDRFVCPREGNRFPMVFCAALVQFVGGHITRDEQTCSSFCARIDDFFFFSLFFFTDRKIAWFGRAQVGHDRTERERVYFTCRSIYRASRDCRDTGKKNWDKFHKLIWEQWICLERYLNLEILLVTSSKILAVIQILREVINFKVIRDCGIVTLDVTLYSDIIFLYIIIMQA